MAPIALVTGAAHRLGKVFALTLAQHGFDIILHFHQSTNAAAQTKAEIESAGRAVTLVQADLTDPTHIKQLIANIDSLDPFGHEISSRNGTNQVSDNDPN